MKNTTKKPAATKARKPVAKRSARKAATAITDRPAKRFKASISPDGQQMAIAIDGWQQNRVTLRFNSHGPLLRIDWPDGTWKETSLG